MTGSFAGFSPDALQFLVDLAFNNERPWFQAHKADYERLLKEPLEALCTDLGDELAKRGVPLRADAKSSPFRIYRDTRFSKDKTPYKTNVAASFPWVGDGAATSEGQSERHGGGGYFHMSPEGSYMGGGMWHPEPARLAAFRKAVDEDPDTALGALEDPVFLARFEPVHGDEYKRVPSGYPADHPHANLLKLKDITFGREMTNAEVFAADLPSILAEDFAAAVPVMRWLASLRV
ncbi:MAG TPA: DUF2461 domain-containing protein [Candidatus Limnocylindrales bacterium]